MPFHAPGNKKDQNVPKWRKGYALFINDPFFSRNYRGTRQLCSCFFKLVQEWWQRFIHMFFFVLKKKAERQYDVMFNSAVVWACDYGGHSRIPILGIVIMASIFNVARRSLLVRTRKRKDTELCFLICLWVLKISVILSRKLLERRLL